MPIQQRSLRNRYHTNNRKISGLWARNHFQHDLALNFSKKIGNVIAPRGGNCVTSTEDISMSVDERTTQQVCTLFIDCMKSLRTNLLTCKIFSETIFTHKRRDTRIKSATGMPGNGQSKTYPP